GRAGRVVGPGLGPLLAGARHGVMPPQALAAVRIIAFDITARAELGTGDTDDHNAIDDKRRARHRKALLRRAGAHVPELFARLHIERLHAPIEDGAEELAVVERASAIDDAAADGLDRIGRIARLGLPDLPARLHVDRHRFVVARDVH